MFWWAAGMTGICCNGVEVARVWPTIAGPEHTAFISQDADRMPAINSALVNPLRYRTIPGIAYRLALVAAGDGEMAISLNSPTSWDVAGGHALLIGAGGDLMDQTGKPIRYSRSGSPVNEILRCFGGPSEFCLPFTSRDWNSIFENSAAYSASTALTYLQPGETVTDPGMLQRAQGCLLGQLAGDALGSLVEFQSSKEIVGAYPHGPKLLADGGTWDTIAGQPTDDSELALALARSIISNGDYSDEAAGAAYARWIDSGPFDIGNATSAALRPAANALRKGSSAAQAARASALPETQSNGALMRISPLGIFGAGLDDEQISRFAEADASLTHPHGICQGANAVFASAIAFAIRTQSSPGEIYKHAVDFAKTHEVRKVLRDCLARARSAPPDDFKEKEGWVLIAFQNAFFRLLNSSTLESGIVKTIRAGGDTDTNAAIAGALLGAAHGRDAVPKQWKDRVLSCRPLKGMRHVHKPRPSMYWPVDALEIAEKLLLAGLKRGAIRKS